MFDLIILLALKDQRLEILKCTNRIFSCTCMVPPQMSNVLKSVKDFVQLFLQNHAFAVNELYLRCI